MPKSCRSPHVADGCLVRPFDFSVEVATGATLRNGPTGLPSVHTAVSISVPSIICDACPEHILRLNRLWETVIQPFLPQSRTRMPITPPALYTLPTANLDEFVGLIGPKVLPKLRVWLHIGSIADTDGGLQVGLESSAVLAGDSSVGSSLRLFAPHISIGFLSSFSDDEQKDSYICTDVGAGAAISLIADDTSQAVAPLLQFAGPSGSVLFLESFSSQLTSDEAVRALANVSTVGTVSFVANPPSIRCVVDLLEEVSQQLASSSSLSRATSAPAVHKLLSINIEQLSLSCQLDVPDISSAPSQHVCMILSKVDCVLETSAEPITAESQTEILLTVTNMMLRQNDDNLLSPRQDEVPDGRHLVRLTYTNTTPPRLAPGTSPVPVPSPVRAPTLDAVLGGAHLPELTGPAQDLSVELRMVALLVYPSLIRLMYEMQALLPTRKCGATTAVTPGSVGTTQASPCRFYAHLTNCSLLLSTEDPSAQAYSSIIGLHVASVVIPPCVLGVYPSADGKTGEWQPFEVAVEGLEIFTERLGVSAEVALQEKRTLLEPIDFEFVMSNEPDGYAVDLECSALSARLDSTEAAALLSLLSLMNIWSASASALLSSSSSDRSDGRNGEVASAAAVVDVEEEDEYVQAAPAIIEPSPRAEMRIRVRLKVLVPSMRLACSTCGQDVAALCLQCVLAELTWVGEAGATVDVPAAGEWAPLTSSGQARSGDDYDFRLTVAGVAVIDCHNSHIVLGSGLFAEINEEPTLQSIMEDDDKAPLAPDLAVDVRWRHRPIPPNTEMKSTTTSSAGDVTSVQMGRLHMRLAPRFAAACLKWAATVWGLQDPSTESGSRDVGFENDPRQDDWVLDTDHCMEKTVFLGTGSNSNGRRLFVQRPTEALHATIVISGGKLIVDRVAGKARHAAEPAIFVGDGVHLVLEVRGIRTQATYKLRNYYFGNRLFACRTSMSTNWTQFALCWEMAQPSLGA